MRIRVSAVAALIVAALLPLTALAGGWVVVTLDGLPGPVRAGEEFTVGFMVRQHGERPLSGDRGTLLFTRRETGERVTATATEQGGAGHYAARVTLPRDGAWDWHIEFWQTHVMPSLTAQPAAGSATAATPAPLPAATLAGAGALALLAVVCLGLAWRLRAPIGRPGEPAGRAIGAD